MVQLNYAPSLQGGPVMPPLKSCTIFKPFADWVPLEYLTSILNVFYLNRTLWIGKK